MASEFEKAAAEVAAAVAKEGYGDLVKPTATEVGKAGGAVAALLNATLAPIRLATISIQNWEQKTARRIHEQHLKMGVPHERLVAPDPRIVATALPQMLATEDQAEVRDMFARLVATSMDRDRASKVHPSFPGIISELSPDDAKALQWLGANQVTSGYGFSGPSRIRKVDYWPALIDMDISDPQDPSMIIETVERLGLANHTRNGHAGLAALVGSVAEGNLAAEPFASEPLHRDAWGILQTLLLRPDFADLVEPEGPGAESVASIARLRLSLTPFGKRFCEVCVDSSEIEGTVSIGAEILWQGD
jgi:hypothetical protein